MIAFVTAAEPVQRILTHLGDIQLSAFLSPASPGPGEVIWGAGAILQMPTNTDDVLGNKNWGLGPTAVVLKLEKGSPYGYG